MDKEINFDMEQLLRNKSWSQLSSSELNQVKQAGITSVEYEAMRAMVLELRSSGNSDDVMIPSETVHVELLDAFDNEQRKRRALWWNGLFISIKDKLRFDIPAIRYGVSGALVLLLVFAAFRFFSVGEQKTDAIVKNESAPVIDPVDDVDSSEKEIKLAVNTDSPSVEIKAPSVPEIEFSAPIVQQTRPNSQVPAIDKSPVMDTAVVAANVVVDSSNILAVVTPANAILTSGSAIQLSSNSTAPLNFTWNAATPADVGSTTVYGITTVTFGPEKTRSLSSDPAIVRTYYTLR